MKCPHCYCNYDDSERECPMCGTRSSIAACRNTKHQSVTYPGARQGGGRVTPKAQPAQRRPVSRAHAHPAGNAAPRRTSPAARPQARTSYNRSPQDVAAAAQKRRRRAVLWVVLVVMLLQLLPALGGWIGDLFYGLRRDLEYKDDGFHFFDDGAVPERPVAIEPEDTPDGEIMDGEALADGIVKGGDYYCESTDLYFTFDFSEQRYWLTVGEHLEYGMFFTMMNDPGVDADYYTEEFPASDFDSYVLYLQPDEEWLDEAGEQYTLVVMYVPAGGTPDYFFLNNTYADARWLPLDRAILLEHWG